MADYPTSIWVPPVRGTNMSDAVTQTDILDEQNAEIVAMQTEGGTNPSGTDATVKARFDRMDTGLPRHGCTVTRATNVAIATGATALITWETTNFENGNWHTAPSATLTVPAGEDGAYLAVLYLVWTGSFIASGFHVGWNQNGTEWWQPGSAASDHGVVSAPFLMAAGFTFTASVHQVSGSTQTMDNMVMSLIRVSG